MLSFCVTNMFFGLHYLCLEKFSTIILLSNEILLLLILFMFERYKVQHRYTVLVCCFVFVADVIAIVSTWTEAISLLPLSASLVFLFSLSFRGVLVTKICTIYTNLAYITYLILIGSYVAIACQCVLLVSAIIGLYVTVKDIKVKKTIKQSRVTKAAILQAVKLKPAHTKKEVLLSNH